MAFGTRIAVATFIDAASGTTGNTSSTLNVQENDLIRINCFWSGGTTTCAVTPTSGSGNVATFDAGDNTGNFGDGNLVLAGGYILRATANATLTLTMTLGAARAERCMHVTQYRPDSGYAALKVSTGGANTGFDSTPASDSGTVGGTDNLATAAIATANTTVSGEQIGGVGATEVASSPVVSGGDAMTVFERFGDSMSGTATSSTSLSDWGCGLIIFNRELIVEPPLVESTSPTDNATGVSRTASPAVTFDQAVDAGSGNFYIWNLTRGFLHETIAVGSASISTDTVTLNPSNDFAYGEDYAITWDAGVVVADDDAAAVAALTDRTVWNWRTVELTDAGTTGGFVVGSATSFVGEGQVGSAEGADDTVEGTGATTAPAQTTAGTGVTPHTGTVATAAPAQTTSGTGEPVVQGAAATTAAAQTTAGVGEPVVLGTAATSAAAQTTSGAGVTPHAGTGATASPAQTLAAEGDVLAQGTGATTAAAQTTAGAGEPVVQGAAATTAAAQAVSATGTVTNGPSGVGATTAAAQTTSGTGVTPHQGTAATVAAAQVLAGSGETEDSISGTAATSAAPQVTAAEGDVTVRGTGATTAAPQAAAGAGEPVVTGSGGSVAAAQVTSGTASQLAQGTVATVAAAQLTSAPGKVIVTGSAALSAPAQVCSGAGDVDVRGTAATTAAAQSLTGAGLLHPFGGAATSSPAQVTSAVGRVLVQGACSTTAAAQVCAGTGSAFAFAGVQLETSEAIALRYGNVERVTERHEHVETLSHRYNSLDSLETAS